MILSALVASTLTTFVGTSMANATTLPADIICTGGSYHVDVTGAVTGETGPCTGSLILDKSVKSIADNAFFDATLTSLTLNRGLLTIGENAFSTSLLDTLILNTKLTSIGGSAFLNANLTSLVLSPLVTFVGDNAFQMSPLNSL